jgi:RNA polymerase sigma factor (sigma-70 family)
MAQALGVVRAQKAHGEAKDAIAEGLRAMCLAWKRYDPALGEFERFARVRVTGAVRRFLKKGRERRALEVLHDHAEELDAALDGEGDAFGRLTRAAREGVEAIADTHLLVQAGGQAEPDDEVATEIARCTAPERELVRARYVEGLSWEEIGARLGMGPEQARYLDKKLRKKLGAALARRRKDDK